MFIARCGASPEVKYSPDTRLVAYHLARAPLLSSFLSLMLLSKSPMLNISSSHTVVAMRLSW